MKEAETLLCTTLEQAQGRKVAQPWLGFTSIIIVKKGEKREGGGKSDLLEEMRQVFRPGTKKGQ